MTTREDRAPRTWVRSSVSTKICDRPSIELLSYWHGQRNNTVLMDPHCHILSIQLCPYQTHGDRHSYRSAWNMQEQSILLIFTSYYDSANECLRSINYIITRSLVMSFLIILHNLIEKFLHITDIFFQTSPILFWSLNRVQQRAK